ncbi:MAG: chromate transporter [Clostridiales bacterium]|nr:chromate transporter [Clostridiales bacterium]
MIVLELIYEFFLTGLFAFGGGLATLPFLYDMGARTGWFTNEDILRMIAVSESTPGALGVNMATYVGILTFGVAGGIIASLALVLPSLITILIVIKVLDKFKTSPKVRAVFYLLRPATIALIVMALLSVAKVTFFTVDLKEINSFASFFSSVNYKTLILAALLFIPITKSKLHPIIFIAISAVIGIIFRL